MTRTAFSPATGFTLIEVLVATALMAVTAVTLAHLVALGRRQTTNARDALHSLIVAQSKLEELRAETWSVSVPGSELALSPADAHLIDTAGFVDRAGPFVRRWSVTRREPADAEVVVINVCAFAARHAEACVATLRTRRP